MSVKRDRVGPCEGAKAQGGVTNEAIHGSTVTSVAGNLQRKKKRGPGSGLQFLLRLLHLSNLIATGASFQVIVDNAKTLRRCGPRQCDPNAVVWVILQKGRQS